ncbi:MAG TPA: GtrA family protein [Roseiflexaceae bacterium]|nr:GtrA family protein [Roseiflexaceae bacterium]
MRLTFRTILQRFARPLRFGLVGVSGIVVNSATLWVLVRELHLAVALGSVVATEAAILSNFTLNDRWTFRGARERSLLGRLLRFNGVALGGMAITAAILTALMSYSHMHLLIANLLAVGAATIWNYAVNSRWTWSSRRSLVGSRQSAVGSQQSAVGGTALLPPASCLLLTGDEEVIA